MNMPSDRAWAPSKKGLEEQLVKSADAIWNKINTSIDAHEADELMRSVKESLDIDTPKRSQN